MNTEIPRYAANPLLAFVDYLHESSRLLHLSIEGVSMLRALPNTVTVLEETDHTPRTPEQAAKRKEEYKQELKEATIRAEFANKERKGGFPLLHAHTLVGLWSAFEVSIEDSLVGMMMNEPDLLGSEAFAKIRIPLAEFEALEKEERMRLLIGELERSQGRKHGVDRFEALLAQVKLSGPVDQETKKTIWEMHHVRNVIVHRGSVADRRTIQNCPWMGMKVGDRVKVGHHSLAGYDKALHDYLMVIIRRLAIKYDVDIDSKIRRATEAMSEGSY
jgi:hypothetical protein